MVDGNGNVYGTTLNGGDNSLGSIFKVAAGTGQVQILASFDEDTTGESPGVLTLSNGVLYGTTAIGGTSFDQPGEGQGTVFSLPTAGGPINLLGTFQFDGTKGSYPDGVAPTISNGVLYGATTQGAQTGTGQSSRCPWLAGCGDHCSRESEP